jgi:hypothetical protein
MLVLSEKSRKFRFTDKFCQKNLTFFWRDGRILVEALGNSFPEKLNKGGKEWRLKPKKG